MAGKTSLDFILNPTVAAEPHVAGLLNLHKAALAHMLPSLSPLPPQPSLPSLPLPPSISRLVGLAPLGLTVQPVRSDEKRFVAIRPRAPEPSSLPLAPSPVVSTDGESAGDDEEEDDDHDHDHDGPNHAKSKRRKPSKKKTAMCKEPDCTSLAVSRRSCVRHGGGSRCVVDGCNNGAKLRNRCFQHGGSTICLADGCDSKAKRYGYCWCHGGGRICSTDDCNKVAAQGGMCWAHGGGNRCKLDGCIKRSYQKYGYFCKRHAMYSDMAVSSTAPVDPAA